MNATCNSNALLTLTNTSFSVYIYMYLPNEWILYQIVWPCLILCGLLSNASFLWTFGITPSLHTPTYIYLVNLACADILTLLTYNIPVVHHYQSSTVRDYGSVVELKLFHTSKIFFFLSSLYCISLVASERFFAICYPVKHRVWKGKKQTLKLICFSWILSFVCACSAVPLFPDSLSKICLTVKQTGRYKSNVIEVPHYFFKAPNLYYWVGFNVLYMIFGIGMIVTNLYMYARIAHTLKVRKDNRASNISFNLDEQFRQVVSMLVINGELFFIFCSVKLTGNCLRALMDLQNPLSSYQMVIWEDIEELCSGLNASINPFVYTLTNQRYRRAFYKAYSICSLRRLNKREANTQPNIAITKL